MTNLDESIPLISVDDEDPKPTPPHQHGEMRSGGDTIDRVSIAKLQEQLAKLSKIVEGDAFTKAEAGGFHVDEIKIIAEVTASGELGFLVAGAKAEAKGSIEITFRRALTSGS